MPIAPAACFAVQPLLFFSPKDLTKGRGFKIAATLLPQEGVHQEFTEGLFSSVSKE